jgi:hypothetical protein
MRRLLALGIAAALVGLAVAGTLLYANRPPGQKRDVALPPRDASPIRVVRAYVSALDARDLATARRLVAPGSGQRVSPRFWIDNLDSITGLRVQRPSPLPPRVVGRGPSWQVVVVNVTFHVQWRWLHDQTGLPEGGKFWGYTLARSATTKPWRIIDEGTG